MNKLQLPSAHTIILLIAGLVALLTWLIPSGQFEQLSYDQESHQFSIQHKDGIFRTQASQHTLDSFGIQIPLEKFTSGDIWKPVGIPNSYYSLDANPQGLVDFIQSPLKGIMEAIDVILFVLIIGGFIGIIQYTGIFELGIQWLAEKLRGREYWLIIIVTSLIALGGTTFGLAEETIAFFPILIPVFVAAGYDPLVAVATLFMGSSIGTTASTVNPFSTIIASDAAGINWTNGLELRVVVLIIALIITIAYILRYARKVKRDPQNSLLSDVNYADQWKRKKDSDQAQLSTAKILTAFIFVASFVLMIYGVSQLDWWFLEMTSIFFVAAILVAFINRIKEKIFIKEFVQGANDLLSVALIIGIARGVTVLMEEGLISDTILYYSSNLVEGMPSLVLVNSLFLVFAVLSFFVPSSSGLAVLTMPIMAPLADVVGIDRSSIVDAYQYGSGLFHIINPTGLLLPSLAIAGIGFGKWIKFILPLLILLIVVVALILSASVMLG